MISSLPRSRKLLLGILLLLIAVSYFSLTYKDLFYAPDEGATVYHFERCFEGAVQHRDFYSVYGFGFYALGKALFQLFGCNLLVTRVAAFILKLMILLLIYVIALNIIRPLFAFFCCLGFIIWWGDPVIATPTFLYPVQVNLVLGLLGILFIISYLKSQRRRYLVLSALAVGMGSLFKPNIAIFNLMAVYFFFISRELISDLSEDQTQKPDMQAQKTLIAKSWVALHLLISIGGIALLFSFFARFGLDKVVFVFFFIPLMSMLSYLLFLGLRTLKKKDNGLYWRNTAETFKTFILYGAGFVFWQIVQVLYFLQVGALQDFKNMLLTAGAYYSNYATPLWKGGTILLAGFLLFFLFLLNELILQLTENSKPRLKKFLLCLAISAPCLLFALWVLSLSTPRNYHIFVWYSSLLFSLYASYFIFFTDSMHNPSHMKALPLSTLSLVLFYTTSTFLDAFPKVDIGHITVIVPPFMILFGLVGQRFYDRWNQYLTSASFVKKAAPFAGGLAAAFWILLFLPSLLMMFMFQVLITANNVEGMHLYQGKLQLVSKYKVTLERAKGVTLHIADSYIGAPIEPPKRKDFFELARRLTEITDKKDKLFSTMTSCLMLYFLADRDGIDGKANCFVFQSVMGVTTSTGIKGFSDLQLTQMVDQKKPKAIIVEKGDLETERFIANWPYTWNFILLNYKISEQIGPYQIYTPK